MSYSMTVGPLQKPVDQQELEDLLQAEADKIPDGDGTPAPEISQHVTVAARVAAEMARKLGQNEDSVSISVSGHAEPMHGQREGWSPEMMHVAVSVLRRPTGPV